jgi:hypothetical protein
VPLILQQEQANIRQEILGRYVSVIFNGTSRLGEALAVVVRFISNEFTIEQRLVKLQMLAKSMKGEEIAREPISVLSATYGIGSGFLLAAMRDGASVNNVALSTLKVVYPQLVDVGCYSHTINHVGERFSTPTLSEFLTAWILLFSHSPKTRLLWREKTGKSVATVPPDGGVSGISSYFSSEM